MQSDQPLARGLTSVVVAAWRSTPIVVVQGARGVGKTTLARKVAGSGRYVDLSVESVRKVVTADLQGWVESLPAGTVIDEAQTVPNLQVELKRAVDGRRGQPGQFLLTGSARLNRTELGGSDPLTARSLRFELEPFAQCEVEGQPRDVITALFDGDPREWAATPQPHRAFIERFRRGGIPVIRQADATTFERAVTDYAESLFIGDIYEVGRNRTEILRLFRHIASTSGQIGFFTKYQEALQLKKADVVAALDALRTVFLVQEIPALSSDPSSRETERGRHVALDPAFVANALQFSPSQDFIDPSDGSFVETVVAQEMRRLLTWSSTRASLRHWRRSDDDEVDLVLERPDGMLVGVEVKSARSVSGVHFRGLHALRRRYPDRFHRGYVIHAGDQVEWQSEGLWSLPFSALWEVGEPVGRLDIDEGPSFQQRLDRAVTAARRASESTRVTQEEAERRRAVLEPALALALQRMTSIADGLRRVDVHVSTPVLAGRESDPTAPFVPLEVPLLVRRVDVELMHGGRVLGFVQIVAGLINETVTWAATGGGIGMPDAVLQVSVPLAGDHTKVIDDLAGRMADQIPDIAERYRAALS